MGKNRRIKRKNKYEKKTALKNSLQKHLDKKVGQLQDHDPDITSKIIKNDLTYLNKMQYI